jgi:hypothetical protein
MYVYDVESCLNREEKEQKYGSPTHKHHEPIPIEGKRKGKTKEQYTYTFAHAVAWSAALLFVSCVQQEKSP